MMDAGWIMYLIWNLFLSFKKSCLRRSQETFYSRSFLLHYISFLSLYIALSWFDQLNKHFEQGCHDHVGSSKKPGTYFINEKYVAAYMNMKIWRWLEYFITTFAYSLWSLLCHYLIQVVIQPRDSYQLTQNDHFNLWIKLRQSRIELPVAPLA